MSLLCKSLDSLLFPVSLQDYWFRKILEQLWKNTKGDLDGYDTDNIDTYSTRRGNTSFVPIGSTASPSIVAINNCGWWTLGTVSDFYVFTRSREALCGPDLGRIMCIVVTFTVSEPHFWTLDPLEQHAKAKQVEIDTKESPLLQSNYYLETVFLGSLQFFHFYKFV